MSLNLVAAALIGTCVVGCDSTPETVVGSDVPQIVGLESRHSSGIERQGETLVAGRFLYRGAMRDPIEVSQNTIARYERFGWSVESRRIMPTSAILLFAKDDREVRIDLKCSMLNPRMGAGSIDVHRRGAAITPAPAQPVGSPATAPAPVQAEGGNS